MIEIAGLTFAYGAGQEELFHGLDFRFEAGRLTAVSGPSGRGKSTLLYVLGLLLRPDRGQVRLQGHSTEHLNDVARSQLRSRHIGFVFQDAALDPSRTVLDNVCEPSVYAGVSRQWAVERAGQLLEHVGVQLRADHRPGAVSGGQAQRVALCRALLLAPTLVLADEPTGNLDPTTSAAVLALLGDAAEQGAAVVIATHDPAVQRQCHVHLAL